MKKSQKNIVALAGVIGTVLGMVGAIPSFMKGSYIAATLSAMLIVLGLVLLAIAFGD